MRVDFGGPCRPTEFDAAVVRNARGTREPAKILAIPPLPTPQRGGGRRAPGSSSNMGLAIPSAIPLAIYPRPILRPTN